MFGVVVIYVGVADIAVVVCDVVVCVGSSVGIGVYGVACGCGVVDVCGVCVINIYYKYHVTNYVSISTHT